MCRRVWEKEKIGQIELYRMFSLYCAATELGGGGLQMIVYQYNNRCLWGKLRVLMCTKVEKLDSGRTPDLFKVHFRHSAARWQPGRAAGTRRSVGQTQERPFKKRKLISAGTHLMHVSKWSFYICCTSGFCWRMSPILSLPPVQIIASTVDTQSRLQLLGHLNAQARSLQVQFQCVMTRWRTVLRKQRSELRERL